MDAGGRCECGYQEPGHATQLVNFLEQRARQGSLDLGDLEFDEEDFNELARIVQQDPGDGRIARAAAANIVNAELRRRLEHATIAYGYCPKKGPPGYKWLTEGWAGRMGGATHQARLVCIEPTTREGKP
jgi:hypothetical protein